MELKEKASEGFKWSILIQGSTQVVNFVVSVVLARILMPSDFGLIGMVVIFIVVGKVMMDSGLASSLIRSNDLQEDDYSTVFITNFIVSLVIYFLLYIVAPTIASFFEQALLLNILRVYGIVIIIGALSTIQSVRLNKVLDFKMQYKLQLPSLIISGIVAIIMAVKGYGVWALIGKEIIYSFLVTVMLWLFSEWKPRMIFSFTKLKIHFSYGLNLLFTGVFTAFFNNLYQIAIGKFFSAAQLGFFTRAKSLGEMPSGFIFNAVNRVMFPLLSLVNKDDERLKKIYREIVQIISYILFPILVCMAILAKPLFLLLLTSKWLDAVPYFQILVIALLFSPLQQYMLNICKVKGRSNLVLWLSLFQYALTAVGLLSTFWFGIMGLLWSIVVVAIVSTLVTGAYAGRLINYSVKEQIDDVFLALIFSGVSGLIVYLNVTYLVVFKLNDFLLLLFNGILFTLVYLVLSHWFNHVVYQRGLAFVMGKFSRD